MSGKKLTNDEMVRTSKSWLDESSARHLAIRSNAHLAPFLPHIQDAHEGLSEVTQPVVDDGALQFVTVKQAGADVRHDSLIRGSFGLLTAMAELAGLESEEATKLIALRDFLLPDGLMSVSKTYRGEAGQADQLRKRLGDVPMKLDQIIVGPKKNKRDLGMVVEEWLDLAQQLGDLEDEKADLLRPGVPREDAATVANARHAWIRTVNAMLATAEFLQLPTETMNTIFGALMEAERVADRRGSGGKKAATDPAVVPSTGETPSS